MKSIGFCMHLILQRFAAIACRFGKLLPDTLFLKFQFRALMGQRLHLAHPKTFNEKIQWLKLNDRKTEYTVMVDKFLAKKYVAGLIGEEYIIPTLGVWKSADDIDFDKLPEQFVLKCNHNSGGVIVCKDKSQLNRDEAKKQLSAALKQNYYLLGREWPYKNVERRIIAEKFMGEDISDYKLMCFNGIVKCSFVCSERADGLKVTFFDNNWNKLPFERHYPASAKSIAKPLNYEKMVELAETLSKGIPFVRVDFYEIDNKVYFGELTFYPGCGYEEFKPIEWDYKLGDWIKIDQ